MADPESLYGFRYGRIDTARGGNFSVTFTFQSGFKFIRAITAIDRVRMAIVRPGVTSRPPQSIATSCRARLPISPHQSNLFARFQRAGQRTLMAPTVAAGQASVLALVRTSLDGYLSYLYIRQVLLDRESQ